MGNSEVAQLVPSSSRMEWLVWKTQLKTEWSLFDLVFERGLTVIMLVFLCGVAVSLFHRAGVILQAAGLLAFVLTAHSQFGPVEGHGIVGVSDWIQYPGPGYFIALAGLFISMFAAKNFWWQRKTHTAVPSISRVAALAQNSTRSRW